jgi:hypothetical protein
MPEYKEVYGCTDGRAFKTSIDASAWQTIVDTFEDNTGRIDDKGRLIVSNNLSEIKYFTVPVGNKEAVLDYIQYHNLPLPQTYPTWSDTSKKYIFEKTNKGWVELSATERKISTINTNITAAKEPGSYTYVITCLHADRTKDRAYHYSITNRCPLLSYEEDELLNTVRSKFTRPSEYNYIISKTSTVPTGSTALTGAEISTTTPAYEEPAYE